MQPRQLWLGWLLHTGSPLWSPPREYIWFGFIPSPTPPSCRVGWASPGSLKASLSLSPRFPFPPLAGRGSKSHWCAGGLYNCLPHTHLCGLKELDIRPAPADDHGHPDVSTHTFSCECVDLGMYWTACKSGVLYFLMVKDAHAQGFLCAA